MQPGNTTTGTDASTAAFIESHLDDDLEVIVAANSASPPISPSLPPSCKDTGLLGASQLQQQQPIVLYLQVVSVENVLLSREQRLRALAPRQQQGPLASSSSTAADNTGGAGEGDEDAGGGAVMEKTLQMLEAAEEERVLENKKRASRERLLRLLLTDGFSRVVALEDTRPLPNNNNNNSSGRYVFPPPVFTDGVALGCKICVTLAAGEGGGVSPAVHHGVLRLHGGNTRVLGGQVPLMLHFAQTQAARALVALQGRPVPDSGAGSSVVPQQQPQPQPQLQQQQQRPLTPRGSSAPVVSPTPAAVALTRENYRHIADLRGLPVQPLGSWGQFLSTRANGNALFLTRAVITDVLSDLLINEGSGGGGTSGAGIATSFSLFVTLAEEEEAAEASSAGADGSTLVVDMGNDWISSVVQMDAENFRLLTLQSQQQQQNSSVTAMPLNAWHNAQQRMEEAVNKVGYALEHCGPALFVIGLAADDSAQVLRVQT